jgi:hypothetical protein
MRIFPIHTIDTYHWSTKYVLLMAYCHYRSSLRANFLGMFFSIFILWSTRNPESSSQGMYDTKKHTRYSSSRIIPTLVFYVCFADVAQHVHAFKSDLTMLCCDDDDAWTLQFWTIQSKKSFDTQPRSYCYNDAERKLLSDLYTTSMSLKWWTMRLGDDPIIRFSSR